MATRSSRPVYVLQGDLEHALERFAGLVGKHERVLVISSAHELSILAAVKAKWQMLERDREQSLLLLHEPARDNSQLVAWLGMCAVEAPEQIVFVCAEPQVWLA